MSAFLHRLAAQALGRPAALRPLRRVRLAPTSLPPALDEPKESLSEVTEPHWPHDSDAASPVAAARPAGDTAQAVAPAPESSGATTPMNQPAPIRSARVRSTEPGGAIARPIAARPTAPVMQSHSSAAPEAPEIAAASEEPPRAPTARDAELAPRRAPSVPVRRSAPDVRAAPAPLIERALRAVERARSPDVHIHIGRVELTALAPPAEARRAPAAAGKSRTSLDEYLGRRNGRPS